MKTPSAHPKRPAPSPQFSVHRAFVVQLSIPAEADAELWQGRVEHVTSGQAAQFGSLAELAGFIEQLMAARPPRPPPTCLD